MIRVVIAEDSAVAREYLRFLLEQDAALRVVGTAVDGQEAVALVERLRPDVVLMDVHMPRLDGRQAARQIMERAPTPIVMVSASSRQTNGAGAFEALEAGALAVVEKPGAVDDPGHAESVGRLLQTVKLMSEVKVVRRWPIREARTPAAVRPAPHRRISLVAIGASTGGPPVVAEILSEISSDVDCPILLVQHIAPEFAAGLADWLGQATRGRAKLGESGERVRAGTVYIAPPHRQMGVSKDGRLRVTDEPAVDGFAPSISHLLRSVARSYGPAAAGVVLTGMGRDGAAGLRELRDAGGVTIAQDEASSVVFGIANEAILLGAAEHILPPKQIAQSIRALFGTRKG